MTHLTPEILVRSWKGTLADLLEALDDFGADHCLDGFRVQGTIWAPWGDPNNDTPIVVAPCARYFRDGKRMPLARALLQREKENGRDAA